MFAFILKRKYSNTKLEEFYKKLKVFKLGYSWGGYDSLITFPPLMKRTFKDNLKGTLIRLYCGLEDKEDQLKDIHNSLKILS